MAGYSLQLTNGNLLVVVPEGTSDSVTTSLTFVGRNFPGYGIYLNQNFVKLTENFANGSAPNGPLQGQLWWDTTNKVLKIRSGTTWKVVNSGRTGTGNNPPSSELQEGDFWWDPANKQLFVWNSSGGGSWALVGPTTSAASATTGFLANVNGIQTLGNISVMGKTVAAFSNADYAPFSPSIPISGITTVRPGLNFGSAVEPTMISSPNMTFGVSSGSITITSLTANQNFNISLRPGNVATTVFSINGTNGRVSVSSDPQEALGVATKQYVDSISANLTSTFSSAIANVTLPEQDGNTVFTSSLVPQANLLYNLGSTTSWWNNIYGTAIHAKYADLAERFEADQTYDAGTVVELGGPAEITAVVEELSEEVFGVISTQAAYLMNSGAGSNSTHPPVAVQGRVPVKVVGPVRKGQRLVSAGDGYARAAQKHEITAWNVIGRALENKIDDGPGTVEAVVKINS